ncbi:hypothetical protein HPB48_012543 [Haemaphysalis longicornis]|uniref:long-chain-fatty-acid--CoA ligase n=1 Tax=Haemaphysalis longicornis TaxID=44386 RepID=A0A9J6GMX0_HAELO|nr:hypothetical protein HPB48_012543 [Haemaphysalis longicornis]
MPRLLRVVDRMPSLTHIVYMESAECYPPAVLVQGPQRELHTRNDRTVAVVNRELRLKKQELKNLKGLHTLDEVTRKAILKNSKRPALGTRPVLGRTEEKQPSGKVFKKLVLGDYEWLTYAEVGRKIDLTARGLLSIGAKPKQYLAILAETRAEWFLTAQACFRTNIPLVTLYATLGDDGIVSAINETEVKHLVTSSELMPRLLRLVDRMPSLTCIVYMESTEYKPPAAAAVGPQVVSFNTLQEAGSLYKAEMSAPSPDDVAIVMFTSGSSGKPKGVIATHKNLIANLSVFGAIWERFGVYSCNDRYMGFLPLAHILELFAESLLFSAGARIAYSSPLTLTDNSTGVAKGCPGDITLIRPTQMACVPLIVDRLRKSAAEAAASKGPLFTALFDYAIDYKNFWLDLGFDTPVLNVLFFNKVRNLLGGEIKLLACGSAPICSNTRRFARACFCCPMVEAYGLTEVCGAVSLMDVEDTSVDRVGAPLSGINVRLVDWPEGNYRSSDKPNPRGEIVVGGPSISKGYFKQEELTREVYREEGGIRWFYTGDIGEFFPDGTLKIIDRKKDLVKLQHGEYISLGRVESVLKTSPLVENVFAYGSSLHTYIVAFAVPNLQQLQRVAERLGKKPACTLKELCADSEVMTAAKESILEHARLNGLEKAELPHKIKLCSEEWIPDSGLVTPTLKIRRKPLQSFYQRDIDALYGM